MATFPGFEQIFERGRNEILARQGLLSRESVQRDGSDANVMVASGAAMGDLVMFQLIRMWNALFFRTATGSDLDRLAMDRYGLVRKSASAALVPVVFSAEEGPENDVTIPAGTQLATETGVKFQTTESVVWTAGETETAPVACASSLAGANQQVAINSITVISVPITDAPDSVTVTNPLASAGAADAETDVDFRARCIAFPQTLLQGTLTAIEQAGLSTPGVQSAAAYEILDSEGHQVGLVQLIIADAYTDTLAQLNQNPASYQTQSQQLAAQVVLRLRDARAAGVYVEVIVAQVVLEPLVLALSFSAGASVNGAALAARIAAQNAVNALRPGQTLDPSSIKAACETVPGVINCTVVTPAGPVIPTQLQVLRTSLGLVVGANQAGVPISQGTNVDAGSL